MTAWRSDLALAQAHAQAGRFGPMQALCQDLAHAHSDDVPALLDIGALLLSFGFLTSARNCFVQAQALAPAVVAPLPCLATGRITFGCFNNTAKFNDGVFDVWARVLAALRAGLRARMQASALMDVAGFTRHLENTLVGLYCRIAAETTDKAMNAKTILHVGPGHRHNGAQLPAALRGSD